jgi:hypothetical protein
MKPLFILLLFLTTKVSAQHKCGCVPCAPKDAPVIKIDSLKSTYPEIKPTRIRLTTNYHFYDVVELGRYGTGRDTLNIFYTEKEPVDDCEILTSELIRLIKERKQLGDRLLKLLLELKELTKP